MNADAHRRLDLFLDDPVNSLYIEEMVAKASPPSERQRADLAELLRPIRQRGGQRVSRVCG